MKTTMTVLIVVSMIAVAMPLAAHHSFSAEYDLTKPNYMDGKITMVQWVNPHTNVFIDVTDKNGRTVNWTIEISPPNALVREGWNKDRLRLGMEICVEGFPEKTGMPKFGATSLTLKATGEVLKTPPGNWMPVDRTGTFDVVLPPPVQYNGKTSCAIRG